MGTATGADVETLRRRLNDVVAMSTLSAIWAGASRAEIALSLSQVLQPALRADVVYVGLRGDPSGGRCEGTCLGDAAEAEHICGTIRAGLSTWLEQPASGSSLPGLSAALPLAITPIGIHAEHGVIVTASAIGGFPSETDRLLLNLAANQATVALLTDRVRDEQRIADIVQRIGAVLASELDPERVIQTVTDEATALTGANFGAFFYNVVDDTGESYMLYTLSGAPREAFSTFPMPRNTAIFAPTFSGSGTVRSSDITQDVRFGHNPPYHGMPAGHLPVRSYLAVPVVSRTGKVHGGLFLGHKDVGVFTERHERLAVGVATWAALAMDNGYLYAEAQRANRAKDEFLATLSHELRTPLNAIVGWLSMLRRPEIMSATGIPKAWLAIDRNTEALTALVEDLLDVSRIVTGNIRLADVSLDFYDVVRDTIRTVEPKFVEKNVSLVLEMSSGECRIRGDAARLRQVISNLLSNAVRFTASEGQVEVALSCDDATARCVITDTGIGIRPDFLPYVFDRFRQGDADATSGLGLGLAIVKNLVELHGGTAVAASEGIGRGSQFTVTLPRERGAKK